ncbi:MAG: zinc-binding dehydrogenase [Rhodospirillaceae bacterium]|nr:zinc-binding dehydrogenase [Rhodospirillaceae bacterium]MDE0362768.1 zinc-binding dehydrogenase [Rhodospirillaceae bacterium]
MKAVVFEGKDKVAVHQVEDAGLTAPHGVVLQVEYGNPAGIRPGHEFIGRVIDAGPEVQRFSKGDRVLSSALFACGECVHCRASDVLACEEGIAVPGIETLESGVFGGQAEAVAVPHADFNLCAIPDGLSAEDSVLLTDVLPTGYIAAKKADISPGDTVAIFGMGPIGLAALISADVLGAGRVLAVDTVPERLERARQRGAIPINAASGGSVEQILDYTDGRGADATIEAVGVDATIQNAISAASIGSTVAIAGVSANPALPIAPGALLARDITLRFCAGQVQKAWQQLLPLMEAGRLNVEGFFTHRYTLDQAPVAYDTFARRADGCFKTLFEVSG